MSAEETIEPTSEPPRRAERDPDDATLLARVADGDEAALSELYDRFSGMLLGMARRVLGSTSDSEEVLQEVFLQVWRQAGRYDPSRSSVSTWLVLITRSRSIDLLRSRKVKERTREQARQEKPPAHTSPTGHGSVLLDERRKRLEEELARIPPEQRQVLELAFFEGMTQSEIAAATDIPLGTVKTRTLLAMKKMRRALDEEIHELL